MDDLTKNSIEKASINVSRNSPVALVVGAAGFLGSHLSEKLLDHKIQVIGVDNFKSGKKENLVEAVKSSHFHLINTSADDITLDLPKLDYIFIVAGENWRVSKVLNLAKEHHSKVVFVSWINLYDQKTDFLWFKRVEGELAGFAKDHKLNARVLRLSAIYGPRMNFETEDPMVSLIAASLENKLQEESTTLEFTTRALFIEDAVNLIVKSVFTGSTAWKIFDGALPNPVKVAEVKQVLLDPIWHENRGFTPSELPPWPTPNLEKTKKELHWSPKVDLVKSLKITISYFKEHEFTIPAKQEKEIKKLEAAEEEDEPTFKKEVKEKKDIKFPKVGIARILILGIFFYAFLYPVLVITLGISFLNLQVSSSLDNLQKGDFRASLVNTNRSKEALTQVNEAISPFLLIIKVVLPEQGDDLTKRMDHFNQTLTGLEHLNQGAENLHQSFRAITGEKGDSPESFLKMAEIEFSAAEQALLPLSIEDKEGKIQALTKLSTEGRVLAKFLPGFTGTDEKNYLVLLQDNSELRPTGGVVNSLGLVTFDKGKIKKIEVESAASIDSKRKTKASAPKEISEDLGKVEWSMEDITWEPDFPSVAARVASFYQDAGGVEVDGVIAYDLKAAENLLKVIGELSLGNSKVSFGSLIEEATAKQGSGFLTDFNKELLNKVFFGSSKDYQGSISSLHESLNSKHLLIYLTEPKLNSLLEGTFTGKIPKVLLEEDFLAVVEANTGDNKANYFLDRNLNLQINKSENGLDHKLEVNLTNRSSNDVWPGGTLKERMRIYVPFGAKLESLVWGEEDITSSITTLVDYGRTVYAFPLSLKPKEAKSLQLKYQTISFKSLRLVKQAGTGEDRVHLTLPGGKIIDENFKTDILATF